MKSDWVWGGQTDRERGACDSEISIVRGLLCVSM